MYVTLDAFEDVMMVFSTDANDPERLGHLEYPFHTTVNGVDYLVFQTAQQFLDLVTAELKALGAL